MDTDLIQNISFLMLSKNVDGKSLRRVSIVCSEVDVFITKSKPELSFKNSVINFCYFH